MDSLLNPFSRYDGILHNREMPVKTKDRGKLHPLHHDKAGTIHEAEILVPVFAEDIPSPRGLVAEQTQVHTLPSAVSHFMLQQTDCRL